jgi:hypothetical protein
MSEVLHVGCTGGGARDGACVGGATCPLHLYKGPLAPWPIHPSLQSSPLWLGSLVWSRVRELEETPRAERCCVAGCPV